MASSSRHTLDDGEVSGPSPDRLSSASDVDMATYIAERHQERRRRDPHHAHPFKRIYIGPSPVSSNSAAKVAAIMKHDVIQEKGHKRWYRQASGSRAASSQKADVLVPPPIALGVVGGTGSIIGATLGWQRRSGAASSAFADGYEAEDGMPSHRARSAAPALPTQETADQSPTSKRRNLSPRRLISHLSPPSPSKPQRRSASTDAHPRDTAHSNQQYDIAGAPSGRHRQSSHGPLREGTGMNRGILRHVRSAEMDTTRFTDAPEPDSTDERSRAPISAPGEAVKFSADSQAIRRQKSEDGRMSKDFHAASSPLRRTSEGTTFHANNAAALPLLDEPVTEEDPWENVEQQKSDDEEDEPHEAARQGTSGRRLRQAGSQRSLGMRAPHAETDKDGTKRPMADGVARLRNSLLLADDRGGESARGSVIIHFLDGSAESQALEAGRSLGPSNRHASNKITLDTNDRSRRGEELRMRARQRFQQSRVGQARLDFQEHQNAHRQVREDANEGEVPTFDTSFRGPASQNRREHFRNMSRQSRMSHASTLNSVGTHFSEGSFGASGGFRARVLRALGAGGGDDRQDSRGRSRTTHGPQRSASGISGLAGNHGSSNHRRGTSRAASLSSQAIRAIARSHGSRARVRGGVVAGAVGTSAGGTKWVGQSFKVGKRFLQAAEARETQLLAAEYEAKYSTLEAEMEEGKTQDSKADLHQSVQRVHPPTRTRSQVLDTFARDAEDASTQQVEDDRAGSNVDGGRGTKLDARQDKPDDTGHEESTPALVGSSFGSDASEGPPSTPPRASSNAMPLDKVRRGVAELQQSGVVSEKQGMITGAHLERQPSRDSLLSVPEDAAVSHDIENRNGWADVMGFINGKARIRTTANEVRARAQQKLTESATKISSHPSSVEEVSPEGVEPAAQETVKTKRPNTRREYSNAASSLGATFVSAFSSAGDDDVGAQKQSNESRAMTAQQALQHPDPPLGAEDKFPEVAHELTRRLSNPGVAPDGNVNETASDHEVMIQRADARIAMQPDEERPSRPQRSATLGGTYGQESAPTRDAKAIGIVRKTVQFDAGDGTRLATNKAHTSIATGGRERQRLQRGDAKPADPRDVLSRTHLDTAYGESRETIEEPITNRSVLKRDRMLVRVAWTPSEDLPRELTEKESRKYPLHFNEPFREFMVVYRMGRLELWDDPTWTMWLAGRSNQLKLNLIAPLKPGRTFASLYSPIDNIFCISFQLEPGHHRGLLNLRRSGTHVWIFQARSVTTAADWMWELWRELGGHLPQVLDVTLPVLGVRVQVPIPDQVTATTEKASHSHDLNVVKTSSIRSGTSSELQGEGYKLITRENVIRAVQELAAKVPQWSELAKRLKNEGVSFGLAWRVDKRLMWVQHDSTTDKQRRDWAVLVGSILRNARASSTLEFRAALHYPQSVRTVGGALLNEPPAIEGFLWRVKAVSGSLTRVYVSSHDGLIFVSRPSRAYPPERFVAADPSMASDSGTRSRRRSSGAGDETIGTFGRRVFNLLTTEPTTLEDLDTQLHAYRALERRRQFEQVSHADGYIDVRDIYRIRCLGGNGPEARPGTDEDTSFELHDSEDESSSHSGAASTIGSDADEEDVGGEEGYELAKDRTLLKQSRQIEFTMSNGRSIRLEAYSRSVACEWVRRITAISRYWKRREKVDALGLMDASGYDAKFVSRHMRQARGASKKPTEPDDTDRIAPLLSNIWNWCVIEACRGIVRSGQLFTKKQAYSAFTSRYCVLVGGRIFTYKLMTSNRTARARQNAGIFHKRQETVIHLRDAYVYSGKLTEHMLVNGRTQGAGALSGTGGSAAATTRHTLPRIYGDGLQSIDDDEECTFVIRYRPQRVQSATKTLTNSSLRSTDVRSQDIAGAASSVNATSFAPPANAVSTHGATSVTFAEPQHRERKANPSAQASAFASTQLLQDKTVNTIALRARSRLERDLWVWAIDCERERLVREESAREDQIRFQGQTPWKPH